MTSTDAALQIEAQLRDNSGAQSLLEASMAWMDKLYDNEQGLLRHPTLPQHMVRESLWYAFGLVLEGHLGNQGSKHERIAKIVTSVLDNQYIAPHQIWHGTFKRSPQEADPPVDAVIWKDYDPNWRQFIGTILLLLKRLEGDHALVKLLPRMDSALVRCIVGEPQNRVPPTYTNIALMRAWLEVEYGDLVGDGIREAGLRYASEIKKVYSTHGAFPEYNAPTYYGINFFALGLWENFSDDLAFMGGEISALLWADIARYYHAGMKNLCGPWSRSYGMDMQAYVAALGLWMWAAIGRDAAPFPTDTHNLQHGHDFCLGPIAAVTAAILPAPVLKQLAGFDETRCVRQQISDAPERWANAYLAPELMIGLETSARSFHGTEQYQPLTIHWLDADKRVCWSRLRFSGSLLGELDDNQIRVKLTPDKGTTGAILEFCHAVQLSGQTVTCRGLSMFLDTDCDMQVEGNSLHLVLPERESGYPVSIICEVSA